jgi:Domain of unknown function (DUF4347)/Bacterial Ig-like domain/Beta-propeller repeat
MSFDVMTPELLPSIAQDLSQLSGYGLLEAANFDPLRMKADSGMGTSLERQIAFIDPTVPDYQTLINGIKPDTEVVVLDPNSDGVQQITDALTGEIYSAVHIISHGSPGSIQIGSSHLGEDNITDYAGALQQWQKSLTPDADILLYGCNVAAISEPPLNKGGQGGISFLQHLAELTSADIAASDNLTGGTALGGDWELEVKSGLIEASLPFLPGAIQAYDGVLNNGDVIWAKNFGGNVDGFETGNSIATDSSGNVYTTGFFQDSATFGSTTLTSNGSSDIFVTKLNSDGSVAWAKSFGGSDFDGGSSIATDSSGNAYTTGRFYGSATFGSTTLTSNGSSDIFVTKFNSDGSVAWAQNFGGIDFDTGNSIATDSSGNVYTTGSFNGSVTFGSTTLTSNGSSDIFVTKFNSDGSVAWAKSFGGSNYDYDNGIATDSSGNVYTTGLFSFSATFGSTTLTSNGNEDIFVTKLNSDGSVAWAQNFGGSNYDIGYSIATDSSGNVYTTGSFNGSVTFGSTTLTSTNDESYDIFVTKFNSDGNVAWAKDFGGSSYSYGTSIATDSSGNVYTTGFFDSSATFGSTTLTSNGNEDIFVTKLNSDGSVAWAKNFGGSNYDDGYSIATDSSGNVYTTGFFQDSVTFGSTTLTSNDSTDIFVAKLGTAAPPTPTVTLTPGITPVENTPTNGTFTINLSAAAPSGGLTVNFNLAGSATSNTDYTLIGGTGIASIAGNSVTIAAGATTATLIAQIANDSAAEGDETIQLNLASGTGYTLGAAGTETATLTIAANDTGVTNTQDSGEGSLRQAILNANAFTGTDTISFNILGTGVQTINLASALPNITDAVVINGYSQSGASQNTLATGNNAVLNIVLNGSSAGAGVDGLVLADGADGSTIEGLVIQGFSSNGIYLQNNSDGNIIRGNFIGINAAGNAAASNSGNGVRIESSNNFIGGSTAAERNLISANKQHGVLIVNNANKVQGNYIGTDASGTAALGNTFTGAITINASSNIIGGGSAGERNLISGNQEAGLAIIGGANNKIQGNYIGSKSDGTGGLGNGNEGLYISANNNFIGGTNPGEGNLISDNKRGVWVNNGTSNSVLSNSITNNAELGITVGDSSATPNDLNDADTGANNLQNFPEFSTLTKSGSNLNITYKVPSATANSAYPIRVEFFLADSSGEGKTFLGFDTYDTANANANKTISFTPTAMVNIGDKIVATATDNNGNTSEFSAEFTVAIGDTTPPTADIIDVTPDPRNTSVNSINITFSEAVTGVDLADFSLTRNGTTVNLTGATVSGSGASYTLGNISGLTGVSGNYLLTLKSSGSGITDAAGNAFAVDATDSWTTDTTAPVVSASNPVNPNPTNASSVNYTVTFSENVTGVDAADFNLTTTGSISGASITNITGSDNTYNVTVNTGTGDGTIRLDVVDDDSIIDSLNNPLGGSGIGNGNFTTGQTYTLDKTAPSVNNFTPTDNATNVSLSNNLVLQFSETVNKGTGNIVIKRSADNSIFETIDINSANVTISGNTVTINPTSDLAGSTNYYLEIANTAFIDAVGNNYAGIADPTSWNFTTVAPPNLAPILDLNGAGAGINYNTTFTRGGGAVVIVDSNNLTLTDDGTNINSATVRITNLLNGASEILSAVTTGTNIAASYNNGILTLTGSDTVANYQTVLRSIAYNNTATIPNTTARNIQFVVNDGSLNSAVATTTLAINIPTINLGNNITTATRSRPPIASLNNTNSEALYSFSLNGATRVVANLMMNGGNADLALLDSNGTILASSTRGGTLAENFDSSVFSAGQYFIRVNRVDPGAIVNYQLSVNFSILLVT